MKLRLLYLSQFKAGSINSSYNHYRGAKVSKEQVHLGNHILTRSDKKDSAASYAMVRSVISYNASYHYYWGQHPAGLIR